MGSVLSQAQDEEHDQPATDLKSGKLLFFLSPNYFHHVSLHQPASINAQSPPWKAAVDIFNVQEAPRESTGEGISFNREFLGQDVTSELSAEASQTPVKQAIEQAIEVPIEQSVEQPVEQPIEKPPRDIFRTPVRERRFSFEVQVPTPVDCFRMARPSGIPRSEPARPAKRKRPSNDQITPGSRRVRITDQLSIGNGIDDDAAMKDNGSTPGFTPTQPPSSKRTPTSMKRKRSSSHNRTPSSSQAWREDDDDDVSFRPGHISLDNKKKTGFFSPEEIETLEHYKVEFCNTHRISAEMFDASIQSSRTNKGGIFASGADAPMRSVDFWREIYALIPDRDQRSIYRFMRRHFATGNTPHRWSPADDDELERLHRRIGPKWAQIAREMERTEDDVVQRWKNKVEHRSTMKEGPWDEEEVKKLLDTIEETRKIHLQMEKEDIGGDIYELDDQYISWGAVSNRFGNTRSRQQCADKWRKIKKNVEYRRAMGEKDAIYEPLRPPKRGRRISSQMRMSQSEDRGGDDDEKSQTDKSASKEKRVSSSRPSKSRQTSGTPSKPSNRKNQNRASEDTGRSSRQVFKSKEIVDSSDEEEDESEDEDQGAKSITSGNRKQPSGTSAVEKEQQHVKKNETKKQPAQTNGASQSEAHDSVTSNSSSNSSDSSSEDDDTDSSDDSSDEQSEDNLPTRWNGDKVAIQNHRASREEKEEELINGTNQKRTIEPDHADDDLSEAESIVPETQPSSPPSLPPGQIVRDAHLTNGYTDTNVHHYREVDMHDIDKSVSAERRSPSVKAEARSSVPRMRSNPRTSDSDTDSDSDGENDSDSESESESDGSDDDEVVEDSQDEEAEKKIFTFKRESDDEN